MLLRLPLVCAATSACSCERAAAQAGSALHCGLAFSAETIGPTQATTLDTSTILEVSASPRARMRPTSLAVWSKALSVLSPPMSFFIVTRRSTNAPALATDSVTSSRTPARASASWLEPSANWSSSPPWSSIAEDASSSLLPTSPAW